MVVVVVVAVGQLELVFRIPFVVVIDVVFIVVLFGVFDDTPVINGLMLLVVIDLFVVVDLLGFGEDDDDDEAGVVNLKLVFELF